MIDFTESATQTPEDGEFSIIDDKPEVEVPQALVESESVYTALLSDSPDLVGTYTQTKQEFTSTGRSDTYANVQNNLLETKQKARESALVSIISDPNIDKATRVAALNAQTPALTMPDLRAAVIDQETALAPDENATQQQVKKAEIDYATQPSISELEAERQDMTDILNATVADGDASFFSVVGDMMKQMLPGYTSITSQKILNRLAETWEFRNKQVDPSLGLKFLLPGELNEVWKKEFFSLSVPERKEFIQHLAVAVKEATSDGMLGKNDFENFALVIEAADMINDPNDTLDWERVLGDVIGVFDLIFLGQLIKGGARTGKIIGQTIKGYANYRSAYNTLSKSVRDEVDKLLAAGVLDSNVAAALGTDPMTIAGHSILPAAPGQLTYRGSAAVSEVVAQLHALSMTLSDMSGRIPGQTIADKLAFHTQILKNIPSYTDHHLFTSLSGVISDTAPEVVKEANQFMLRLVFGYDKKVGFGSASAAETAAKNIYPSETPLLLIKDPATKRIRPPKPGDDLTKGEFFYSITKPYEYGPSAKSVASDTVAPWGAQSRFVLDTQHMFDRDLMHMPASIAGDRHRAVEKLFLTTFSQNFGKLPRGTKLDVVAAIAEESRTGVRFTVDDLVQKGWTSDHFQGYTTIRGTFDVMYSMANKQQYKFLLNEGYQWLSVAGKAGTPVKPINEGVAMAAVGSGKLDVYDPILDAIVTMTKSQVEGLLKSGGRLGTILHAEVKGNRSTKFIRIDENVTMKGGGVVRAELEELPKSVLPYNDTYYTRYYKDRFFILERGPGFVNGTSTNQFDQVLGVAATNGDAQAAISKLKATNPGKEYFSFSAKSPDKEGDLSVAALTYSLDRRSNQPLFGSRGAHLTDMTTGALADIHNPIDALKNAVQTVSKGVMFDDMLETMRMRWVAKHSDKTFPIAPKKNGKFYFPALKDNIKTASTVPAHVKQAKQARAEWEYINFLSGQSDPIKVWSGIWHGLANNFIPSKSGGFVNSVRTAMYNLGDKDPFSVVRAMNFTLMIGLAPIRQVLLQTQQFLYIAPLNMKYTLSGQVLPHYIGLTLGIGTIEKPALFKEMTPVFAKLLGMKNDEAAAFIRSFRDSGLPYSIDTHLIGRDSIKKIASDVTDGKITHLAKTATNVVTSPLRLAKTLGFDFGEYNNLAISYLYAKKDFAKKFKGVDWKLPSSQEWIGGRARELALSMNAESAFKYQRGWLSLGLQFMQIQHKALLASLSWTNKNLAKNAPFTRVESGKIAIGQLALWGAEGFGFAKAVKWMMDKAGITPETPEEKTAARIIETGLGEMAVNTLFGYAFSDGVDWERFDFSLAANLAPASGIFSSFGPFAVAVLTSDKQIQQLFLGPTWANIGRFQEMGAAVYDIFNTENPRDVRFWTGLTKSAALLSSFGTKVQRVMFALATEKEAGSPYWLDSKYNKIREASVAELTALGLFGVSSHDIEGYYKLRKSANDSKREAKDMAKGYYERLKRTVALINDDHPYHEGVSPGYKVYKEYLANEESWLGMIKAVDEEMYTYIQDEFVRLVLRDIDSPDAEDALIDQMATMLFGGAGLMPRDEMINKMNDANISLEKQEKILNAWDFGQEKL